MLKIKLKYGEDIEYSESEYTTYEYNGKAFIVINKFQWIGIYNFEYVKYIEYIED